MASEPKRENNIYAFYVVAFCNFSGQILLVTISDSICLNHSSALVCNLANPKLEASVKICNVNVNTCNAHSLFYLL